MIVVMSQKFFVKHVAKLAEPADYLGMDGENYGITNKRSDDMSIASKYSHIVSTGSYTPEVRLYDMLRKRKRGEPIDKHRYQREVEYYLEDTSFISVIIKTFKALYSCGFNHHINVFVILPNVVYKFLGGDIIKKMIELADQDFGFIFSQEELKSFGYDKLEKSLRPKQLKAISNRVPSLEKKYKIIYKDRSFSDDWD